jgi:hypothetical protein
MGDTYDSAAEAAADRAPGARIRIAPTHLTENGQRYRVSWAGKTLIESTRNPEHDACRALLARGITGRLEVWRAGTTFPASSIDIERGAGWTISETEEHGPRLVRWRPFEHSDGDAISRSDGSGKNGHVVPAGSVDALY